MSQEYQKRTIVCTKFIESINRDCQYGTLTYKHNGSIGELSYETDESTYVSDTFILPDDLLLTEGIYGDVETTRPSFVIIVIYDENDKELREYKLYSKGIRSLEETIINLCNEVARLRTELDEIKPKPSMKKYMSNDEYVRTKMDEINEINIEYGDKRIFYIDQWCETILGMSFDELHQKIIKMGDYASDCLVRSNVIYLGKKTYDLLEVVM